VGEGAPDSTALRVGARDPGLVGDVGGCPAAVGACGAQPAAQLHEQLAFQDEMGRDTSDDENYSAQNTNWCPFWRAVEWRHVLGRKRHFLQKGNACVGPNLRREAPLRRGAFARTVPRPAQPLEFLGVDNGNSLLAGVSPGQTVLTGSESEKARRRRI